MGEPSSALTLCSFDGRQQDRPNETEQRQRVKVDVFGHPITPMQTRTRARTVAGVGGIEHSDARSPFHPGTHRNTVVNRFVGGVKTLRVPDADDASARDDATERHDSAGRGEHGCSGWGPEIDTTMPRAPLFRWRLESAHHRVRSDRPGETGRWPDELRASRVVC